MGPDRTPCLSLSVSAGLACVRQGFVSQGRVMGQLAVTRALGDAFYKVSRSVTREGGMAGTPDVVLLAAITQ